MDRTVRPQFLAVIFLVGAVAWFNFDLIFSSKVPFFRDLGPIFYPMRFSLTQSFQQGELPLWDRHVAMGFPLLANFQSGVFYPPHLVFLFLPFFVAIRALFVFHYLVAAAGAYSLCRRWGYPTSLALMGAILFAFGGYTVSLSNMLSYFQTAVWLPWAVLLGERAFCSQSAKGFFLFVLVLLVQFLGGAPEIYGMSQGLLLLDGLRVKAEEAHLTYRRLIAVLLAANVLVAGLAMVQILPTTELFLESRGHHALPYQLSARWSLHPLSLLNLFFLDKEVDYSTVRGLTPFFSREVPLMISLYIGALALPAIFLWFAQSSLREKTILSGLVILILILSMGNHTPLYPFLFDHVVFFSLIRYPEKFFFLNYALFVYIVLRGLVGFFRNDLPPAKRLFLIPVSILALFFLLYVFFRFDPDPLAQFISQSIQAPRFSFPTADRISSVFVQLERQMILLLGLPALCYFRKKSEFSERVSKGLLALLVFVDLSSAHRPYQYSVNPDFIYKGSKIISTPDSDPYRLFYYPERFYLHPSHYSLFERKPSFFQSQALLFTNLFPNTGVFYGFDYMQDLDSLKTWPYVTFVTFADRIPPEGQYRLLGALNVKYMMSLQALPDEGLTLLRHVPEDSSWLYGLNRVVPRVYIVSNTATEKEPVRVLARLSSSAFDPFREVILEKPLPLPAEDHLSAQAEILHYANQQVKIRASLSGAGVLVLTDSFYPGWRAYVDGKEEQILRANLFFRAVALSAGDHVVEFRYRPRSFLIGLIISGMFLGGVVISSTLLLILRKHR